MAQWFLEWGWAAASLVAAIMLLLMGYRSSVASWNQARGEWKVAVLMEVGPFITFGIKVGIGVVIFSWATMYIYGAGQSSPIAQGFKILGSAGVAAIGGTFQTYEVSVPEAPSLIDMAKNNVPTEADVRNVLGVPASVPASAPQSVPAASENAAPANNWVAPAANTYALPARSDGATPIEPEPVQASAPSFSLDTRLNPEPAATMTTLERIQANIPGGGAQYMDALQSANETAVNGGGGPSAINADNAVSSVGVYTVKAGDSLNKISMAVYGNRSGWARICNANRDKLRDCNDLRSGMVLTIP